MKKKMAASYGSGIQSPPQIGRPVDRVFEDAQFTGEIHLNGRKLRDYPKLCSKYDLSDTIFVDISRNRLTDLPCEVCEYLYVERINCYHNVIRSIPDAVQQLQALTHLNLSRNQLSVLPTALCLLGSLEVLSASNNKLVSLPEEIGELKNLMDLDVSCNEISHLPLQIGDLSSLRCLNLRRNFLVELPLEISRLQLYRLDISSNRIERIPTVFRKMETLEQFILDHNPLSSPPAYICTKGKQHIMKFLQIEAIKEDRKRGVLMSSDSDIKRFVRKSLPPQQPSEEFKNMLGAPESKWKRHTVLSNDSGYSTGDGSERNGWQSGEIYPLPEEITNGQDVSRRDGDHSDNQSHYHNYNYHNHYQSQHYSQPQQQQYQPHQQPYGQASNSYVSRSRSGSGLHHHSSSTSSLERSHSEPLRPGRNSPNPLPTSQSLQYQKQYQQDPSHPHYRSPPHPYPHSQTSASASYPLTSTTSNYPSSPSVSHRRPAAPSPAFSSHSNENQNSVHNSSFTSTDSGPVHSRQRSNISLTDYPARQRSDMTAPSAQRSQSPSVSTGYRTGSPSYHYGGSKSIQDRSGNNSLPPPPPQSPVYANQRGPSPYGGGAYLQPSQLEQMGQSESPPLTPPTPPMIMTGDMEDEFTRELKRQKAEYERKKKQAEAIRVQREEEEREKDERRRAAQKVQEEQKLLLEKQEEQRRQEEMQRQEEKRRQEEARLQEERRKREEEESRRKEEEMQRLQEIARIQEAEEKEKLRLKSEAQRRTESKLPDKNNMTNNHHYHTNPSSPHYISRPQQPPPPPPTSQPPQPPNSLPVHGFMGPASPSPSLSSASSSSSYQLSSPLQQQEDNSILSENEYRNALSSQSFKEQRRLASSTQYRRAASDTLKKPGQGGNSHHQVDNLNYINRNGVSEHSRQSSTSTTPSVSPSPSPRNSVSHLAKPSSPSSSTSHLAKPSSPSGSTSHLAKPVGTKSSVPRANGPTSAAQSQAVRRTKIAGDRSNTSSPVTARSTRTAGPGSGRTQGSSLNPASSNLRRSSNSSATDEDSKPKKASTQQSETSRLKSRFEEQNKRGGTLQSSGLKKSNPGDSVDTNKRINTRPPTNAYGSGRGRIGGTRTLEDSSSNFTIRRREEQQREEAEQMDRLRQTVESRLRVTLPDNLAEALRDGVVLCHLANQIRPRSVGSIHVPSPAVPKLTLAKCRRNVDNFLDACRKIGVDQEQICGPQDIFDEKGISRVAITVAALVAIGTNPKQSAV